MTFSILVTCPKGLEYLLEEELKPLGFVATRVSPQGVYGQASLTVIYVICLWSRIANRVLLVLFEGAVTDQLDLYGLAHDFPWQTVFQADVSLAIHFQGSSDGIRNTMFGSQVIKDGIVDYCRDHDLARPTIDKDYAQIRLRAYLRHDQVMVCLDLVGYSLHQRGYRLEAGEAPIKENVAAAMLVRAKWPLLCQEGYGFYDPCCGSGTLVIEAAMMAARMAPGLLRQDQGLPYWTGHDPEMWTKIRMEAEQQQVSIQTLPLWGTDADVVAIEMAKANALRAGVERFTAWAPQALGEGQPKPRAPKGLLLCNPPYGERLSEEADLIPLYQVLGRVMHRSFSGWQAAILTSSPELAKAIGLRAHKQYKIYNGPLACQLYCMTLDATNRLQSANAVPTSRTAGAQMFANRLKKSYKHLQRWAGLQGIDCYRVYDADLPEYAYAIDVYKDYAVLQEYAPPSTISAVLAEQRRQEVIAVVPEVLNFKADRIVVKQRTRQRGTQQYEKIDQQRHFMTVKEGAALLKVNLHDYLDTGLFLDHRLLRLRFANLAPGTRFLNCFSYTGTASVHAALAGALTTNVDLSKTYLAWAEDNFRLNHLNLSKHQFVHFDCLEWLTVTRDRFDVIFLDPPSFSNSKRMSQVLDIARDHERLIRDSMRLLAPGGTLYFSTNLRHFKLAPAIISDYAVKDITAETIDLDFKRHATIHLCFMIKFN